MVRRRSTVRFRKGDPRSESLFECNRMTPFGGNLTWRKGDTLLARLVAGQRLPSAPVSGAGGILGGSCMRW
jgi:hypothetical protein